MKTPQIDCSRCGRHFAAFNFTWHLWTAHNVLLKGDHYAVVYWAAVRKGRITY